MQEQVKNGAGSLTHAGELAALVLAAPSAPVISRKPQRNCPWLWLRSPCIRVPGRGGRAAALSGGGGRALLQCHVVPRGRQADRAQVRLGRYRAQGRGGRASRSDRCAEAGRDRAGRAGAAEHRLVFAKQQLDRDRAQVRAESDCRSSSSRRRMPTARRLGGARAGGGPAGGRAQHAALQHAGRRSRRSHHQRERGHRPGGVGGQAVYGLAWTGDTDVMLDAHRAMCGSCGRPGRARHFLRR